jgi:hypothetical protein
MTRREWLQAILGGALALGVFYWAAVMAFSFGGNS